MLRVSITTDPALLTFTIRTKRKRTKNANETSEKRTNASHERYEKCTIHETNERTHIHERTNHWSVTLFYPMTNDPGSIEVH